MELEDRVDAWIKAHPDWTERQLLEEMDHERFPLDPYEAWGRIKAIRSTEKESN